MAVDAEAVPARIGRYEIGPLLGTGSGGTVHRARDPFVGREVAIKLAHPDARGDSFSDAGHERTFFSEARAAGQLSHPNIVGVFDAGVEGPWLYIVMEYVPGTTLRDYGANSAERLPVERVTEIAFQCCRALDYAHRRGVIHRDVKPGNILLAPDGTARLADFSIALMTATGPGKRSAVVEGTPHYMAPEQVRGEVCGPATDLYALGAVIFELLTGRKPFPDLDVRTLFRRIVHERPPKLREVNADVPVELGELVDRALAAEPRQRHESGAAFAAALTRVHDELSRMERRMARTEQRDLLRGLAFFADFSDQDIDAILGASRLSRFRAGDRLVREGELDASFYILVLGSARVEKGGVRIETLGKGDCFGEMGLLAESSRTASIVGETDGAVLRIRRSLIEMAPQETQLLYYRTFSQVLVYRLAVTSARLSAALRARGEAGNGSARND